MDVHSHRDPDDIDYSSAIGTETTADDFFSPIAAPSISDGAAIFWGRSLRRPEQKTGAASPFHFARAGSGRQTVISETTCCDRDFHGAGGLLEIPES